MTEQNDKTKVTPYLLVDTAGGKSDKGPVRKANEDAFGLPDEQAPIHLGHIYIVADGVGGQEYGSVASETAVRVMHDLFYQARLDGQDVPAALQYAAEQANLAIYDEAQERGASRMGCTLVTAVHHEGQRTLLHAGDARAYLLRGGNLQKLTRDDTWVQRQVEEGLIGEDTAQRHELRHVVTRVLGNKPTVETTLSTPSRLEPEDRLLLCSDGLHDAVSQEKMQQILAGYSPQAAANALVEMAIQAKAQDNITVVVIHSQTDTPSEATVAMLAAAAKSPAAPTVARTVKPLGPATPESTAPSRPRQGIRLPLWALAALALAIILSIILGASALWRQLRPAADLVPTTAAIATNPALLPTAVPQAMDTAVPRPTNTPLPLPTPAPPATPTVETAVIAPTETASDTPEPEATAESNLACVNSPGAFTFIWQDFQISGSNCDQFAFEGYVLNDGDQVIIIDPAPIGVLGPDSTCIENQFVKIQSVADTTIEGWVLVNNVDPTTPEQGCPP